MSLLYFTVLNIEELMKMHGVPRVSPSLDEIWAYLPSAFAQGFFFFICQKNGTLQNYY